VRQVDRPGAALDHDRFVVTATGWLGYQALNALSATKLELRLARDPVAAAVILDDMSDAA
jgi:hypothetical protein